MRRAAAAGLRRAAPVTARHVRVLSPSRDTAHRQQLLGVSSHPFSHGARHRQAAALHTRAAAGVVPAQTRWCATSTALPRHGGATTDDAREARPSSAIPASTRRGSAATADEEDRATAAAVVDAASGRVTPDAPRGRGTAAAGAAADAPEGAGAEASRTGGDAPAAEAPPTTYLEAWRACTPEVRRALVVLALCGGVESAGVGMVVPFLPGLAEEFSLGATGVGLVISACAFGKVVSNLPCGWIADAIGRRPLLIWGQLITAAGILGTALAPNPATLFAARFVVGAGAAASTVGTNVYTADVTEDINKDHRGMFLGVIGSISSFAYVIGPAVGGLISEAMGFRGPFYAFAAITFLTTYPFYRLPETLERVKAAAAAEGREGQRIAKVEVVKPPSSSSPSAAAAGTCPTPTTPASAAGHMPTPPQQAPVGEVKTTRDHAAPTADEAQPQSLAALTAVVKKEVKEGWVDTRALLKCESQVGLVLGAVAAYLGWAAYLTLVPLHATAVWGANAGQLGIVYSIASGVGLVGVGAAGYCVDKYGRLPVLAVASVINGAGCLLLYFSSTYPEFLAALTVWEVGEALLTAVLGVLAVDLAPKDRRGLSLSLQRQASDVTLLTAPLVLGLLADVGLGAGGGIAITAVLSSACLGGAWALLRRFARRRGERL